MILKIVNLHQKYHLQIEFNLNLDQWLKKILNNSNKNNNKKLLIKLRSKQKINKFKRILDNKLKICKKAQLFLNF